MRVTLFASETEASGHRLDVTWPELCTMLSEFISSPSKTGQRGWSPAIFRGDHRRKANVEELSCLVLDIDTPDLPSLPEGLAWHAHSTFSGNNAPPGTASGILVATFGAPASATLTNNVLEGKDGAAACAIEGGAAATITSNGGNVISDGSCNPIAGDQSSTDALLDPLADNGGPTLTHALGAGSPAIDFAGAGDCPATDQRGESRPQGAGCDSGSVEQE